MDYNVQYEETEPNHIAVTLTTGDGEVVATGVVATLDEAKAWASANSASHYNENHPPTEPISGEFSVSVGD